MCNVAAPDVYDLDDDGYCIPPVEAISDDLRQQALAGAKACPERALTIVDE